MLALGLCATISSVANSSPVSEKSATDGDLRARLSALGAELGAREAGHAKSLDLARKRASDLHAAVTEALDAFHESASAAGAPHLRIEMTEPALDQKHVRAMEFEVRRGRTVGIVTVKSRGDVTLVGPFRRGKNEGPCRSIAAEEEGELRQALVEFLGRVVAEASAP